MNVDTGEVWPLSVNPARESRVHARRHGPPALDGEDHRDKIDLTPRSLNITPADRRKITGKDMAMIFQEPCQA